MRRWYVPMALVLLSLLLVSCEGAYVTSGASTRAGREGNTGFVEASAARAHGTIIKDLRDDDEELGRILRRASWLDVWVELSVGQGLFRIEVLGEDDAVMLAVQARDGESLERRGHTVVSSSGTVRYRVTAVEARDVEYVINYVIE